MPLFTVAQQLRWKMATDGGITWNVQQGNSHQDHIEMSGRQLSAIIRYGNDKTGQLVLKRKLVFPMLRTIPNNTHGSLIQTMDRNIIDSLRVNGQLIQEVPTSFHINGYLQSTSTTNGGITIQRRGFPSTDKAAYIEQYTITNTQPSPLNIDIPETALQVNTDAAKGVYGTYVIEYKVYDGGQVVLPPAGSYSFSVVISGRKATDSAYTYSAAYEWDKRSALVTALQQSLVLQTPDDTLNRMFAFAKVRFAESIFDTKGGLMHAPGGGAYYAAVWANDQAEYANPLFPFLGYAEGNESARNSFRLFAKFMNPEYRPIPSSIIAEGTDIWNGAGDRGDQAMIAYGASLFALYGGDTTEARRLWPLISWCNEYLRRKKTSSGVIPSDSDEMEGRFKAGKINLSTNVLAYGGLVYGSRLARALGQEQEAIRLQAEATQLEKDIDTYFGATVEGYNTYQYYEGNTTLRAWISAPLAMGLLQRKEQTIRALLSEKLWTKDGILTESGSETFWDRSALYAFKGMFKAGATALALPYFKYYSSQRLLGDHVPYAIEAWPEGDQRHLAAESGLYARVITEGMFGIDPISFSSFKVFPQLPSAWKEMALRNIRAFNHNFDLRVVRAGKAFTIEVSANGKITQRIKWDGKAPVSIRL
jgi:hypothetical protein